MANARTARPGVTDAPVGALPGPRLLAAAKDAKKPKRSGPEGCKQLTVWIPEELKYRLDEIVRFKKSTLAILVNDMLDVRCKQCVIDPEVRSAFARIQTKLRESGEEKVA